MKNYCTYNSLMAHIRKKGIAIKGSPQKSRLKSIGYYHGYKGYRFYNKNVQKIKYEKFSDLLAVIEFDEALKVLLYGPLMKLETAIKSYVCDIIITSVNSSSFSDIFESGFEFKDKGKCYRTRDSINSSITKRYQSSQIVKHFFDKNTTIPLWAIFEELMLGELSSIIEVLKPEIKLKISDCFGIDKGLNTNGTLLPQIIFAVKDLRNAVAHNKVIFDGRYMEFKKRDAMSSMLEKVTQIESIKFNNLIDDIIIIIFLMKNLKFKKEDIKKIIFNLDKALYNLKAVIPNNLFQNVTIGFTDKKKKQLLAYVKK